jgi:carboxypeptidase C (cathepsin A)
LKKKDALLQDNHNNNIIIPVRGAAIGNGWMDPFYQYDGSEFAYGLALIDWPQLLAFREMEAKCQAELNQGNYNVGLCFDLIDKIIAESHGSQAPTKASGYDVRLAEQKNDDRDFPPGHKVVETYLGGHAMPEKENGKLSTDVWKDVLVAIHASAATQAGQKYQECTDPPYEALSGHDGLGVVDDVVEILEHDDKVELLFFNGVFDIICNHVGNERFLEHLQWSHRSDWLLSDRYAWFADSAAPGQVSGYMKEYQNLKFLKVMNAGHMVPMDVPGVALDMMKLLIHGGSFRKSEQRLDKKSDQDKCPLCPTCQARDSRSESIDDDDVKQSSSGAATSYTKMAPYVISYAWLVAGVALFAFTIVLFTRRRSHQLISTQPSPYEVELSHDTYTDNGSPTYKDEPANGNGVI